MFLSKDGNAKLGDLNVSKVAKKGLLHTQTGTPYYASPEVWKDQPYDSKSDIWSLGCVLYEVCTLKPPFRANDMNGLYKRVLKGAYTKIPSQYSTDLASMIKTLLQVQSNLRPSCDQILAMDVVKKRVALLKQLQQSYGGEYQMQGGDDDLDNMNLLNTIKVPKNLTQLTKNLPKSNYMSTRDQKFGGSGASDVASTRMQSEPAGNRASKLLPSIASMKDITQPLYSEYS